jgi:hypothetical protein
MRNDIPPGYQGHAIKIQHNPTKSSSVFFNLKYLSINLIPTKIEIPSNTKISIPFAKSRVPNVKLIRQKILENL